MNTIGSRLSFERRRLRLSQVALASLMEVSRATASNFESDRACPDANALNLARHAGINVWWVLTGDPSHAVDWRRLRRAWDETDQLLKEKEPGASAELRWSLIEMHYVKLSAYPDLSAGAAAIVGASS